MTENITDPHLLKSIEAFQETARIQEQKGIKKYGQHVNPSDDYDWLRMTMEELTDAVIYLQAEREKRKITVAAIKDIVNSSKMTNGEKALIEYLLFNLLGQLDSDTKGEA